MTQSDHKTIKLLGFSAHSILIVILLAAVVYFLTWFALGKIRQHIDADLTESMGLALAATQAITDQWAEENFTLSKNFTQREVVSKAIKDLLIEQKYNGSLDESIALSALHRLYLDWSEKRLSKNYFLVNLQGEGLASMPELSAAASQSLLQKSNYFQNNLSGKDDLFLLNIWVLEPLQLVLTIPIFDEAGGVIAVFGLLFGSAQVVEEITLSLPYKTAGQFYFFDDGQSQGSSDTTVIERSTVVQYQNDQGQSVVGLSNRDDYSNFGLKYEIEVDKAYALYDTITRYVTIAAVSVFALIAFVFLAFDRKRQEVLRSEKLFDEHESLLREAQRVAGLGHWEHYTQSKFSYWSNELYRIFGLEPQQTRPGHTEFSEFIHPRDRLAVTRAYKKSVKDNQPYKIEHRLLLKDGSVKYVQQVGKTEYDEKGLPVRSFGTVQDITDRKQKEIELQYLSEKMHLATQAAGVGLFDWDIGNNRFIWDDTMFDIYGIDSDDFSGSYREWQNFIHPDDLGRASTELQSAIDMDREYNTIFRIMRAGNGIRHIKANAMVFRNAAGIAQRMMGTNYDITETVNAQLALKELNDQLEDRIEKRTEELDKARKAALSIMEDAHAQKRRAEEALSKLEIYQDELREAHVVAESANEAKSRFLATMSHEIRTPMNGVVGMLDLLRQHNLDREQAHLAKVAKNSALALLNIINDVLDFSKIEADKMTIESIPIDWNPIIENSAELMSEQIYDKHLKLYCLVDPQVSNQLVGDPVRIRQIVLNLLGNAIKFTSTSGKTQGEIVISVSHLPGTGEADWLRLSIKDNGIGMSEEQQKDLFEPFSQADDSTHREFGGSGLGLSICIRLVELMQGKISCQSEPGTGSNFIVDLPYKVADQEAEKSGGVDLSGLKVLWINSHNIGDDFMPASLLELDCQCIRREAREIVSALSEIESLAAICIGSDNYLQLDQYSRQAMQQGDLRVVILQQNNRFNSSHLTPNSIVVTANPFMPQKIKNTIAVAVGRESPEIEGLLDNSNPPELPEVELAEKLGELILIVEDNANNQEVLKRQVNIHGYAAMIASQGEEALALLGKHKFGLIITDCHMPIMDGYEFTRVVRKLEESQGGHIPIIAATANALQGEEEKCLNAGMDDYVTKPIELKDLQKRLFKWLGKSRYSPDHSTSDEPSDADPGELDLPIDKDMLVKYVGADEAFQKKYLESYRDATRNIIGEFNQAVMQEDWQSVSLLAHKLKSSSRAAGATKLGDYCKQVELSCKQETDSNRGESIQQFLSEAERVLHYLEEME